MNYVPLFDCLQPSSQVQKAKISPTSDEYVLDQLSISEEKLLKLLEEIDQQGHDLDTLVKEMEDEDVRSICVSIFICMSSVYTFVHFHVFSATFLEA